MTKKELKQMETEQKQKRNLRHLFLNALSNFDLDVNAIQRVNNMNGIETTEQMREDILKKYPILTENGYLLHTPRDDKDIDFSNHRVIFAIRQTENTYRGYLKTNGVFEHGLDEDDIVVEDIRNKLEIINLISFMHRFGYKRIVYVDRSTNCLSTLSSFVQFRAEIIGVNRYIQYGYDGGLIIDIGKVDLGLCIEWMCSEEKKALIKKNSELGRPTKQEDLDAIETKYNKISVVE